MTDVFEEIWQEGFQEGYNREVRKFRKKMVKRLFSKGFPIEEIKDLVDVTDEEIDEFIHPKAARKTSTKR